MSNHFKLGGQEGMLTIEIDDYENPDALTEPDANWLSTTVTVRSGPFTGSFRASLTTDDLVTLRDRLKEALESLTGEIQFRTTEHDVTLEIEFNKRGGATVVATLEPKQSIGASLTMECETDQSFLSNTLKEIEQALREFPVRKLRRETN